MSDEVYRRDPYKYPESEAYATAINILAVEYLIKTDNKYEYNRRIDQLNSLNWADLNCLWIELAFGIHASYLGAIIAHGDYEYMLGTILEFLDDIVGIDIYDR